MSVKRSDYSTSVHKVTGSGYSKVNIYGRLLFVLYFPVNNKLISIDSMSKETPMKTALIIGINGNFGAQMALEMHSQGWRIQALMRNPEKAPAWLDASAIKQGSASDLSAVEAASEGVDVIVYAANPPYHLWPQQASAMLEPTLQVAQKRNLTIVFPGNVYGFQPQSSTIDEQVTVHAPTAKGQIRVQMETRLKQASTLGARVLIVRAGDFIGANTAWTWIDMMLKVKGKRVTVKLPHAPTHRHYWSYLPDLCANALALLERMDQPFEVYHDPGLALNGEDWRAAFDTLGLNVRYGAFPWWALSLSRPFSPLVREVWKMRYLWQQPVIMEGHKLSQRLGSARQQTSLTEILQTLTGDPKPVLTHAH